MSPTQKSDFKLIVCVFVLAAAAASITGSDILEYYILEEQPPDRIVGDLLNDFKFDARSDRPLFGTLRFFILTQPPADRRYFTVNETTGIIQTTHRIDREKICPGAEECIIKFDVAVKPNQYFQIIKVRTQRRFFKSSVYFMLAISMKFACNEKPSRILTTMM
jgi:Cadherin-like